MSPTTTSNLEHLALDGPVGAAVAVAIGLGLLALFAWSLRREQRILGRRHTILFWVLRAVALATVIWMLLAPVNVRVETSRTRRAVAIVTDVSGSMQTVDQPGSSDDLRWVLSNAGGESYTITRSADAALAAMGVAQRHLQTATEALRQRQRESRVVESTSAASDAIDRVRRHLEQVEHASDGSDVESRTHALATRLVQMLDGSEFRAFSQLAVALSRDRTPSQKGWRESLPDLEHRVAGMRRTMYELARHAEHDESGRMARRDPGLLTSVRNASRLVRAADFVNRLEQSVFPAIQEKADVRLSTFDRSLTMLTDQRSPQRELRSFVASETTPASTVGTDLSGVLEELGRQRREQPFAAVVMLTDSAHNQPGNTNPRDVAATLTDTPVYVVPIGNTQHVRDVSLQSVFAPAIAMRNDDIVIEARLQAYDCEGEVCVVQLMQDGEVVDFREVVLDSTFASRTVRFEQLMRSMGTRQFQIAIDPLDGELTEENNYRDLEVNVTRSDIKVLLADEMPRWEYRYLAQLFRRDAKVECDELLFQPRMIATGRREDTKTLPITVDDWDQYDVVLLGDLPPEHFPVAAQESLIGYLKQRGGTVVMIAGSESMPQAFVDHPLEDILPVVPIDGVDDDPTGAYAFRVTEEGQDHHALMIGESAEATRTAWDFVNRFSPLYAVSKWRQPRPSAHTLISAVPRNSPDEMAAAARSAFLCWQPIGQGRIVYLSGADTYRLRFLRGDRLHYRFWGQLLRWAIASDLSAGSKFVRLRTDKSRYDTRESVQATIRLTDSEGAPVVAEGVEVRVTSGDEERTVPLVVNPDIPGEYVAEIRSLSPGVYRIEPIGTAVEALQQDTEQDPASTSFTVQADLPLELVDTRSDRALAQQIAEITGGQVLPPTAVNEILELTNLDPIVTEKIETRPLWLEWKYLWLVFGCLQTEWVIRKWKGLS